MKGIGFGPKLASTLKPRQTSSQHKVELEIYFLRLKYLWRLDSCNLMPNKDGLNTWRFYYSKEINNINNYLRRSCDIYDQVLNFLLYDAHMMNPYLFLSMLICCFGDDHVIRLML